MTLIVIQNNGSVFFLFVYFCGFFGCLFAKKGKVKKSSSMKELKIVLRLKVLNDG